MRHARSGPGRWRPRGAVIGALAKRMTYRATQDVVRRVMPLLDRLAARTIDKARLLQYFAAMAGVDWGVHDLIDDDRHAVGADGATERQLTFRDRATGIEHCLSYPSCLAGLPPGIEALLLAEYKRLATDQPLTRMDERLFSYFFGDSHCVHCRWRGPAHRQIHLECWFAGYPVNYEAE